jgi:hypothetical protein
MSPLVSRAQSPTSASMAPNADQLRAVTRMSPLARQGVQ